MHAGIGRGLVELDARDVAIGAGGELHAQFDRRPCRRCRPSRAWCWSTTRLPRTRGRGRRTTRRVRRQGVAGQILHAAGAADDRDHVGRRIRQGRGRRQRGRIGRGVIADRRRHEIVVRVAQLDRAARDVAGFKDSLNVMFTGVLTATPFDAPTGLTATTVGAVVSTGGPAATVVNVVKRSWPGRCQPGLSHRLHRRPPSPYTSRFASGLVGVRVAVLFEAL